MSEEVRPMTREERKALYLRSVDQTIDLATKGVVGAGGLVAGLEVCHVATGSMWAAHATSTMIGLFWGLVAVQGAAVGLRVIAHLREKAEAEAEKHGHVNDARISAMQEKLNMLEQELVQATL